MLRSLYSGVSGMKGFQTKLDVIGNNISNVNTVGFKKSAINFQDLLSQNMSSNGVNPMQVGLGSQTSAISTVHTAGSSMTTGVGTDLSIQGDGFFVVADAQGDQFLTRAGNFLVNANGDLVTTQGHNVLAGNGNAINIPLATYSSFAIDPQGQVIGKRQDNGAEQTIATIGISTPENPAGLRKVGGSLYEMTASASPNGINSGTAATRNTQIASGMLEMSNVDLTEEFTEMIIAQRGFQANSRTITTSDEILQEVVNLKR